MKNLFLCAMIVIGAPCLGMDHSLSEADARPLTAEEERQLQQLLLRQRAAEQQSVESDTRDAAATRGSASTDSDKTDSHDSGESTRGVKKQSPRSVVPSPSKRDSKVSPRPEGKSPVGSPRLRLTKAASVASSARSSGEADPDMEKRGLFRSLSLSIGRKTGRSSGPLASTLEESDELRKSPKGSPRSPRPSLRREELEKIKSDLSIILQQFADSGLEVSDTRFKQLLKKAQEGDSLQSFAAWVQEKSDLVSVDCFRVLFDALVDEGGVDFAELGVSKNVDGRSSVSKFVAKLFEKESEKIQSYFTFVLSLVEAYSKKLTASVRSVFPIQQTYAELGAILTSAICSANPAYPTGLETKLCLTLREALTDASGETTQVLCETLVTILINAHEGRLKGHQLGKLKRLVERERNFKDAHVLGAFALEFGGKLEPDVYDKLLVLARGLDKRLVKKEVSCVKFLENWADEHDACITRFSFNQITGEGAGLETGHGASLESFGIDKSKTLTVKDDEPEAPRSVQGAKKAESSLKTTIQALKDGEDTDSTWTRNLKKLDAVMNEGAQAGSAKSSGRKDKPRDPHARATRLLHAYAETKASAVDDSQLSPGRRFESLAEQCPVCREELPDVPETSKIKKVQCLHVCSLCWICKKPLGKEKALRVNVRQQCMHVIHEACCNEIEPHKNTCLCGVCGTVIQANGQFRMAYEALKLARAQKARQQEVAVLGVDAEGSDEALYDDGDVSVSRKKSASLVGDEEQSDVFESGVTEEIPVAAAKPPLPVRKPLPVTHVGRGRAQGGPAKTPVSGRGRAYLASSQPNMRVAAKEISDDE